MLTLNYLLSLVAQIWAQFLANVTDGRQHIANVNSRSRSLYAVARPSVVCHLSVTFVHPTQLVEIFRHFSTPFATLAIHWHHRKFYGDRPRGTPLSGELNARGVAKYSDFGRIEGISRKRCEIGGKLVLITNRKSHMSFRLVSKSVTLNDLERHNGRNYPNSLK